MTTLTQRYIRTAASRMWGTPDSCKAIYPGVYAVSTPSHGGYIVSDEAFELSPILRDATVTYTHPAAGLTTVSKFEAFWVREMGIQVTFYAFEEDCDWAVLFHHHPEVMEVERAKEGGHYAETVNATYVRGVVERWNPDFLIKEIAA